MQRTWNVTGGLILFRLIKIVKKIGCALHENTAFQALNFLVKHLPFNNKLDLFISNQTKTLSYCSIGEVYYKCSTQNLLLALKLFVHSVFTLFAQFNLAHST